VGDPVRKLDRTRRDARRFAADARRLAARGGKRVPKKVRAEIEAACGEVEAAAQEGDPDRLSAALRALDALWDAHLSRAGKPAWRSYAEGIAAAVAIALVVRALALEGYRIPSGSMAPTLVAGDHVLVSKLAYGVRVPFTGARVLAPGEPRRGDVIVFESPHEAGVELVKRVVGVAGDVVELREQVLHVNGVPQPRAAVGEFALEAPGDAGDAAAEPCRRWREALAKGPLAAAQEADPGALEASWQRGAASGVATYEVLQCRRPRLGAREGPYGVVPPGHVFVLGDNRDRSFDGRAAGGWHVPLSRVRGRAVRVLASWGAGGGWPGGAGPRLDRLLKRVE
jgi:signal peptidase I